MNHNFLIFSFAWLGGIFMGLLIGWKLRGFAEWGIWK